MKKLLLCYCRENCFPLLLVGLFFLLFGGVYSLYDAPWEAFFYGAALCLFSFVILFVLRFVRFVRQHEAREHCCAAIETQFTALPPPSTLAEEDYQEMVQRLGQHCQALSTAVQTERQDNLDYYTTWVHQIKTPIAVMQMILNAEDTSEHRALGSELFRIEQYVEMVLSYIRLGSDQNDFVFQALPLDGIIRQSIRKYAPQFIRKKIGLHYQPTSVTVLTDEKWLCFLLEQLLSNAIKYTWQGCITISVTEDRVLTIRDTGIGIAPEDLPRIFEKGFTGYNGRWDKKSTGLGLYLCKQTADKLGISIWAASTPGVGTAVSLDLSSRPLEVE